MEINWRALDTDSLQYWTIWLRVDYVIYVYLFLFLSTLTVTLMSHHCAGKDAGDIVKQTAMDISIENKHLSKFIIFYWWW